ncbi:GNAT family N-acetyltransferase [Acidiphilium sp.]|uniref:GNAT family N-acetyltransferase n=1 Tax=Acidiphilium sp. TaxID=527 RepID=UPI003D0925A2
MTNPTWRVTTSRLRLDPVGWGDLADLTALKTDPRAFALMLGGVRSRARAAEELAEDIGLWGRHGYGMWTVRGLHTGNFIGLTGLADRPDGRGIALRFALWPEMRGAGLAREAAAAALRYGHDRAGLPSIIAVSRADNFASRTVLGSIGMIEIDAFVRNETPMLIYQSLAR